jgi:hypothetical protein
MNLTNNDHLFLVVARNQPRKNLPISVNRVRKICTPTHHTSPGILKHGFVKKYTNYEGLKKMTEWYNQAFKK